MDIGTIIEIFGVLSSVLCSVFAVIRSNQAVKIVKMKVNVTQITRTDSVRQVSVGNGNVQIGRGSREQ